MRSILDEDWRGTRFLLFPEPPYAVADSVPEVVRLSPPPGSIGPGPADARMYVIDPIDKPQSYGLQPDRRGRMVLTLPPWTGPVWPPAVPDADGHFDHLDVDSPEFEAAHVYAAIRFTLDIWECYFGGAIPWHFGAEFERLEVSILRDLDNARMGYGFLEAGYHHEDDDGLAPFTLNFDVLAHEVGHAIIYSVVGLPDPGAEHGEYFGFHESAADLTALVAVLHFDTVVDRLLANTRGNLDTYNRLSRIGELSGTDQIRVADNLTRLSDFVAGWDDEHDLSEPMTGAMFDIFVDIYHEILLERGLIGPEMEDLADQVEEDPAFEPVIQALFEEAYAAEPEGFRTALIDARDTLGAYLAGTWSRLDADYLNYADVMAAMLDTDLELSGGRYARLIEVDMAWRDIGTAVVGPKLPKEEDDKRESHAQSVRTLVPLGTSADPGAFRIASQGSRGFLK